MKNFFRVFGVFFASIVAFFAFEIVSSLFNFDRVLNLIENIIFSILLVSPTFFISSVKFKKTYLILAIAFFNICLFLETFYFYKFQGIFSESAFFVILESNIAEMKDFFNTFIDAQVIVLLALTILLIFFSLKRVNEIVRSLNYCKLKKGIVASTVLIFLITLKLTKLIVFNVPYLAIRMPISYHKEMGKLSVYGEENPLGNFTDVKRTFKNTDKETYIVVIGESTNRKHFNLQGSYYRETSPKLNALKSELLVYDNVISPHVYTIGALSKALTLGNYENPKGRYEGSLIQLLNQANFKTYWLSNQRPIGMSDTHVTKIARGAHTSIFLNFKHTSEKTPYDEILLEPLQNALNDKGDKKIIFLHMIGTHFYYNMRYPEKFNYFKDTPVTKFKSKENFKVINAYDNVMRYTDSLLAEIISMSKKQSGSSFVLYFSDHGQEVFDEIDFFGQTVDQMVTKNMYEIPFVLWRNDKHKKLKFIQDNLSAEYMTDDVIHSIADLCGVESQEIELTRSVFSDSFEIRQRIIKDSLDYNTYFQN